jgi:hypothetical protein
MLTDAINPSDRGVFLFRWDNSKIGEAELSSAGRLGAGTVDILEHFIYFFCLRMIPAR